MIDRAWAESFARDWVGAWNSRDIERIFSHYSDDLEMTSPLIVEWMGIVSGTLKGKGEIRPYWSRGLVAHPPLRFEILDVMVGVNTIAIAYRNVTRGRTVVEHIEFDERRMAVRAEALYGPPE